MDEQTQISSPPFPTDPSLSTRPSQYNSIRADHSSSQEPGNDGYDSNRSPTGSGIITDPGNAKRRKVNHGMFIKSPVCWECLLMVCC